MKVFVVVSGEMLGSSDVAYLQGVYSTYSQALDVASRIRGGEVIAAVLDEDMLEVRII